MRCPIPIALAVAAGFAVAFSVAWAAPAAASNFSITLDFSDGGLTSGEEAVFEEAANYWDHVITGYKSGISGMHGVYIDASAQYIDGAGGILAQTSPGGYEFKTASNGVQYTLLSDSSIVIDSADIGNVYNQGYLYPVIVHEMAHAMGFGTVWDVNNVYVDGSGHYTGAAALAAYQHEFVGQQNATYVPVELAGGPGTADGHWNEVTGGAGPTGIVTYYSGQDMEYELMTGWLNLPASQLFVSQTTIHQFEDLGYTVFAGDANYDGTVNGADLNIVLANFNKTGMTWAQGDFTGDGTVNGADLNALLSNFGENDNLYGTFGPGGIGDSSLTTAVPEPGTLSILLGAALASLAWGARKFVG